MVGTSNTEQITDSPSLYVNGLQLSFLNGSQVLVQDGLARDIANITALTLNTNGLGTVLDINVTGLNGVDVPILGTQAWYYLYIIGDSLGANPTGLIASLAPIPLLPVGYNIYRKIGWFLYDGDFVIQFYQDGNSHYRYYEWLSKPLILTFTNTASGQFDVLLGHPPTQFAVYLTFVFIPAVAGQVITFYSTPTLTTAFFNAAIVGYSGDTVSGDISSNQKILPFMVAGVPTIGYTQQSSAGAGEVWINGFDDYI